MRVYKVERLNNGNFGVCEYKNDPRFTANMTRLCVADIKSEKDANIIACEIGRAIETHEADLSKATEYNGYKNYQTWRLSSEILDNLDGFLRCFHDMQYFAGEKIEKSKDYSLVERFKDFMVAQTASHQQPCFGWELDIFKVAFNEVDWDRIIKLLKENGGDDESNR